MRVPTSLLRERVQLASYQGRTGAGGPYFAPARTVRARLEGARAVVRQADRSSVAASAVALIQHDVAVEVEDQLTVAAGAAIAAGVYTVLKVTPGMAAHHPAHTQLLLGGPK